VSARIRSPDDFLLLLKGVKPEGNGHVRCSTKSQDLESQLSACRRYCDEKGFEVGAGTSYGMQMNGGVVRKLMG